MSDSESYLLESSLLGMIRTGGTNFYYWSMTKVVESRKSKMLVSKFRVKKLVYDRNRHNRSVRRNGERILKRAAEAWLEVMLTHAVPMSRQSTAEGVPVATGMARAALRSAGHLLGVPIIIHRAPGRKSRISEGEILGSAKIGVTNSATGPAAFRFEVSINVEHFLLNNRTTNPQGNYPPWKITLKANRAFGAKLREGMPTIPHIRNFIIAREA